MTRLEIPETRSVLAAHARQRARQPRPRLRRAHEVVEAQRLRLGLSGAALGSGHEKPYAPGAAASRARTLGEEDQRCDNQSIGDWLDELASAAPAPGGGAAAALDAAMAAALLEMVCNLTIGKPAFADARADDARGARAGARAARGGGRARRAGRRRLRRRDRRLPAAARERGRRRGTGGSGSSRRSRAPPPSRAAPPRPPPSCSTLAAADRRRREPERRLRRGRERRRRAFGARRRRSSTSRSTAARSAIPCSVRSSRARSARSRRDLLRADGVLAARARTARSMTPDRRQADRRGDPRPHRRRAGAARRRRRRTQLAALRRDRGRRRPPGTCARSPPPRSAPGSRCARSPSTSDGAAGAVAALDELSADETVDAIICLTPLPAGLSLAEAGRAHRSRQGRRRGEPVSLGRLAAGLPAFAPATARAVIEILHATGTELEGVEATVVGRSTVVGKPLALLLLAEQATVTVCHSRTRELRGRDPPRRRCSSPRRAGRT